MGNYIYYSLVFSGIVIFSYLSYRSEKKQKNYYQKITSAYTMGWGATPSSHRVPTTPGKAGEDSSAEGSAAHENEHSDNLEKLLNLFLLGMSRSLWRVLRILFRGGLCYSLLQDRP